MNDGQDETQEVAEVGNAETANLRLRLELARMDKKKAEREERKAEIEERKARLDKERVEMELAAQGNAGARAKRNWRRKIGAGNG